MSSQQSNALRGLAFTIIVASALVAYTTLLVVGLPSRITVLFLAKPSLWLVISIILCLYGAYRLPGWLGVSSSFTATLILFASQLSAVWRSSTSLDNVFILGGLLPMADAASYYTGILRLLEGGSFASKAAYRPLSHGAIATIMGLTQQNLQMTIAIVVLLSAIACFLLAREIQSSHGTIAAVCTVTIIFFFYQRWIGTLMTENLGLALGATGLASLWRGATHQKIYWCFGGMLLFTFALNTRAGAFFLLPALLLWGIYSFRGKSLFSNRFLIVGSGVILLGFILNSIVAKVITANDVQGNANFSYTLYGLVTGGKWSTVLVNYPELLSLPEPQRSQEVYSLAWQALQANPFALAINSLRAWQQFMFDDFIFSFFSSKIIAIPLYLLCIATIIVIIFRLIRNHQTPLDTLIIAALMGMLLSVPFVPPWDAGIRVHAAIIPFFALLPLFGLSTILPRFPWNRLLQGTRHQQMSPMLLLFSLSLASLMFFGPIITNHLKRVPAVPKTSCPNGEDAIYFRNSSGSSLNLLSWNQRTNLPNIRLSDFKRGLNRLHPYNANLAEELKSLPPHNTIFYKINLKTNRLVMIIANQKIVPKEPGILRACVTPKSISYSHLGGKHVVEESIYYAHSLTKVPR